MKDSHPFLSSLPFFLNLKTIKVKIHFSRNMAREDLQNIVGMLPRGHPQLL